MMAQLMRTALYLLVILVTGVRSQGKISANIWRRPTVFYANHQSHGDFLLIWAALPVFMRHHVRPVAAGDYWLKTLIRRFLALKVFNMVLINRGDDPKQALSIMSTALQQGDSLIIFPEGTRNSSDELLPFKSGLFYLYREQPNVDLLPVWIENIQDVLPKGRYLPVPMLCSVYFGTPYEPDDMSKSVFLEQAREKLIETGEEE
ncbi:1-acyl-sn-glycerol-3-phosphate acyltransferase [Cardiobacteriaceae bacterium TAE3-ERU3]|nr:1-acyl-sn-glycerol-3-phosphate acyltransferase [Cardiobacteriaceae bacterium TAE3-ERU3]